MVKGNIMRQRLLEIRDMLYHNLNSFMISYFIVVQYLFTYSQLDEML